jgi:hypothetical protein
MAIDRRTMGAAILAPHNGIARLSGLAIRPLQLDRNNKGNNENGDKMFGRGMSPKRVANSVEEECYL